MQKAVHTFLIDQLYDTKGMLVFHEVPKYSPESLYLNSMIAPKVDTKLYSAFGLAKSSDQTTPKESKLFFVNAKFECMKKLISYQKLDQPLLFSSEIADILKGHSSLEVVIVYKTLEHEDDKTMLLSEVDQSFNPFYILILGTTNSEYILEEGDYKLTQLLENVSVYIFTSHTMHTSSKTYRK